MKKYNRFYKPMFNLPVGKVPETLSCRIATTLKCFSMKMGSSLYGFISGLPKTKQGYNVIWVVVDRLTKTSHFIPGKSTYRVDL